MEEIIIDEEHEGKVVSVVAYKRWKLLMDGPILSQPHHTCSDGKIVNLGQTPHWLRQKISHLPDEEQKKILDKSKVYFSFRSKSTILKKKAFGETYGRPSKYATYQTKYIPMVVELFGKMFSMKEVFEIVNKGWDLSISMEELRSIKRDFKAQIEQKIEVYKSDFSDARLAYKKARIEEMSESYYRLKFLFEVNHSVNVNRQMMSILDQIRKEVEGENITLDANIKIEIEQSLKVHIRNELMKTFNLKEIILSRFAARYGLDAQRLLTALNVSFYAKYSLYSEKFETEEVDKPYPSTFSYDIEVLNEKKPLDINSLISAAVDPKKKVEISNQGVDKVGVEAVFNQKKAEFNSMKDKAK